MSLPTALTGNIHTCITVKSANIDANGNSPSSSPVTWSTSAASVAIVQSMADNSGGAVITCLTNGTATITATAGSATATFALTVITPSQGVATSIEVEADQSFQPAK